MSERPRLARPCSRPSLVPREDGTLYCPACDDVVHDLTRATRAEASRLFRANGGKLCGLVHTYPDGELRFAPEPARRRLLAAAGGAALAIAVAGCDGGEATTPRSQSAVIDEPPREEPARPGASRELQVAPPPAEPTQDPAPSEPSEVDHRAGDASPHRHVHETHRHRHAPVIVDSDPLPGGLEGL